MPDITAAALAAHLKQIGDPDEVNKFLRQARMRAAAEADAAVFEPPIRTLDDYLAADIKAPPVLVHPTFVVRGGVNVTVGRAGKGKTVMNLNRNLRWAAGKPMFDGWSDPDGRPYLAPDEPLRILIVENEGSAGMFHRQIGVMVHSGEFLNDADRKLVKENILIWGDGGYSGMKLDDVGKLSLLRAGVEKWKPDLVYIEPFRSLWSGEENSSTEMSVVLDNLVALSTDYECGVAIAHHEKKSGSGDDTQEKMNAARGSTGLEGIVAIFENFESIKGGDQREATWSKVRYQDPDRPFPSPVRMEWVHDSWWYRWVPQTELDDAIIRALRENADEAMTVSDLSETLDETKRKLYGVLKGLADDGRVKKVPSISTQHGSTGVRYRLPSNSNPEAEFGGLSI